MLIPMHALQKWETVQEMKYKWLNFEKLEAEEKKNKYLEGMKSDSYTASTKHIVSMNIFLLARLIEIAAVFKNYFLYSISSSGLLKFDFKVHGCLWRLLQFVLGKKHRLFEWVYILMFFLSSQFEDGLGTAACNLLILLIILILSILKLYSLAIL